MSGQMAEEMDRYKATMAAIEGSGWSLDQVMFALTYYEDGCAVTDDNRTNLDVIMATILNLSPEMQQKTWTKLCLGYINNNLRGMSTDQIVENLMKHGIGFASKTAAKLSLDLFIVSLEEVRPIYKHVSLLTTLFFLSTTYCTVCRPAGISSNVPWRTVFISVMRCTFQATA